MRRDAGASSRRKQAARERAVKEREQRLAKALAIMNKIKPLKQPKPSKRRGKKDDDAGAGGSGKPKAAAEPRVSTTDADARVMKMTAVSDLRTTTGQRFGCNMISAITNKGALAFMVFEGKFKAPMFVKFLGRLLKQVQGKVYLIVDRHPVHRCSSSKRSCKPTSSVCA